MKITIFAATGGIGRQVLEQAVAAGHDVTAVVRNPRNLPSAGTHLPETGPHGRAYVSGRRAVTREPRHGRLP